GMMYRFSFDAYASHERDIFANVGGDNGSPAWSIYGGDTIPVRLTTNKTKYYQTFIMKYPTSGNIRVEFNCANDTGKVFIDNVSLIPLDAGKFFIISPSQGQILKAGSKFNIEWQTTGSTKPVDVEYSLDSGVTWQVIGEGIDNLGILAWNVPTESSEKCFIRIKDAETDSVIGISSIFQINKFGAPVKTGELIVNGGFTNSQQGWNVSYNGAEGIANFRKGMFELTINEPGQELISIILSQGELPVLQGKEYTLSFEAFANGERNIEVALVNSEDKQPFLDTVISLPSVQQKIILKITPPADAILALEFRMGGSYAGVFIDNVSFYTGQIPNTYVYANVRKIRNENIAIIQHRDRIEISFPSNRGGVLTIYKLNGIKVSSVFVNNATKIQLNIKDKNSDFHLSKGSYIALFSDGERKISKKFIVK
ncbi:MAG: carbohydrate binding domain-containing protein, partial [Chitinispirillaceae bacterium]|nr:carbohydrate binding domain-containing protein [Chitinispirillaceae bacterium]